MSRIKGKTFIEWKSVPTKENPADLRVEVVKYVTSIINSGKVTNGFYIKHNGLNNQKLKIARNLI